MFQSLFWLFFLAFYCYQAFGQVPAGFSFQTVVRGVDGRLKKNTPVNLVFALSPGQNASPVWQETQSKVTDAYGVATVVIGDGTTNQVTGPTQFSAIPFGSGEYWISVYLNTATANNLISRQKLWAVPYARYAEFSNNTLPTGMVMPFAGVLSEIPKGWILCDGRTLNANDTAGGNGTPLSWLFKAIRNSWGGTGAGDFRAPDLRGRFLRGVSDVDSLDPDRASRFRMNPPGVAGPVVGSYQGDAFKFHNHNVIIEGPREYRSVYQIVGATSPGDTQISEVINAANGGSYVGSRIKATESDRANRGNSTENRPKNAYVYYIIKL